MAKRRRPGAGRKPTPTALKVLKGNPGKRALPKNEPQPKASVCPRPPRSLKGAARTEWRRMAKKLHELGLLTHVDRAAFTGYCVAWSRFIVAQERVETEGAVIKRYGIDRESGMAVEVGTQRNPWAIELDRTASQLQSFLSEFGLSPSSRSRVQGLTKTEEENDPLARYMRDVEARRSAQRQ